MAAGSGGSGGGGGTMRDMMIRIGADTTQLRQQFQQAQQNIDQTLNQIIQRLNQMQQAAQNAQQQTQNAAQNMAGGWQTALTSMGGGIGGLVAKIGGLAAAYLSLQGVMEGFKATNQIIDDVDRLAQNMNISTERASAYRQTLAQLDLTAEEFEGATKKLMGTLSGNQKIFDKWGVSVRDSSGNLKSQEDLMQSTLARIGQYANGSDRAAAAQKLLGVDLDTVNKMLLVNEENLKAGAAEAERFGLVVGDNQVTAMNNLKEAMFDMDLALDGLKVAFFSDLIPAVTVFVEMVVEYAPLIKDAMSDMAVFVIGVFEDLYDMGQVIFEGLSDVLKTFFGDSALQTINWAAVWNTAVDMVKGAIILIVAIVKSLAEIIKMYAERIGIYVGWVVETFNGLKNLSPSQIASAATTAMEMIEESTRKGAVNIANNLANVRAQFANLGNGQNAAKGPNPFTTLLDGLRTGAETAARGSAYNKDGPTGTRRVTNENMKGGGGGKGDDEASKLIKAQTELIKAELQSQLDLMKEKNREEKNLLDEQLRSNEIAYKTYYERVAEMAKQESSKQIEIKQAEMTALKALQAKAEKESDKVSLQAQIVKLQTEINVLKMQEVEIDKESARALKQKMEDMQKMKIDLMSELSQASGVMNVEAEFAAIEKRYEDMKKRFAAEGDKEGEAALEKLLGYKKAQLQIAKFQQDYDLLDTNLRTREIELETLAKKRGLTDNQLQKQKLALQREEIDNLIEIKQRQLEVAEASYGANSIQAAQIKQSIAELQNLKTEVNEFAKGVNETMSGAFSTLFKDFMDGTKSAKDMFKDFVGNIVEGINQIVAQLLSQRLMNAFANFGGGNSGGGLAGIFSGAASAGGGGGAGGGGFWSSVAGLFGGKANGGFVAGQKPYMVGENGPELFVPRTSGDIVNTNDLQQMGMGGKNRQSPVIVNITTPDPHAFRKTQQQTMAELSKTVTRANNRNN